MFYVHLYIFQILSKTAVPFSLLIDYILLSELKDYLNGFCYLLEIVWVIPVKIVQDLLYFLFLL